MQVTEVAIHDERSSNLGPRGKRPLLVLTSGVSEMN